NKKSVPSKPSMLVVGELLYMVHDDGVASCLEAATGETVWVERLGGKYSASPLSADGKIYFCSHEGHTTVIAPGREYQELAVNHLGSDPDDGFRASPAVSGKALFLRSKTHLYRIEE
ncbi:MAG: PQQ-binding-like beta-propeller repeat protein, partial [Planctomycetaceae bacterium]